MSEPLTKVLNVLEVSDGLIIRIPVYEGEDPIAARNRLIGILECDLPGNPDIDARAEVGFRLGRDGVLNVTARVPGTDINLSERLRIDPDAAAPQAAPSGPEEADLAEPRENLAYLIADTKWFAEHFRSFLSTVDTVKIWTDLRLAEQALHTPDLDEYVRMAMELQADLRDSGLASQLYAKPTRNTRRTRCTRTPGICKPSSSRCSTNFPPPSQTLQLGPRPRRRRR
jgi:molecular chaperone DnaK